MKFKDMNSDASDSLEAVEERLSVVDKLKRKYGPDISAILAFRETIGAERSELLAGEELLENLETVLAQAFDRYVRAAGKLSNLRKKRAADLEKSLAVEFALLGMKKAIFKVDFQAVPPSLSEPSSVRETGMDDIEFLISPNPGENPKALRKIASGGELSRVMLALKAIGKDSESSRTLIFDEIDSGIGGKTADCVADKLKQLAAKHQVICITHLPQIAAAAVHHFRIEKSFDKSRTYTKIMKLDRENRVEEIARLISGTHVTEAALQTAREMLAGTGHPLPPSPKARQ